MLCIGQAYHSHFYISQKSANLHKRGSLVFTGGHGRMKVKSTFEDLHEVDQGEVFARTGGELLDTLHHFLGILCHVTQLEHVLETNIQPSVIFHIEFIIYSSIVQKFCSHFFTSTQGENK